MIKSNQTIGYIIGGSLTGIALLVFIFVFRKLWKNNQHDDRSSTISSLTDNNSYSEDPNPNNKGGKHRRNKRKKRYLKN